MKKYLYVLILSIGVFSCSKSGDDNTEIEPEVPVIDMDKAIIGTWKYTTFESVISGTKQQKSTTGTFVVRNDGTFSMTGELIGEDRFGLIYYYGESSSVSELEGTYTFYNQKHFNFHIDENKYPNLFTRLNVPTSIYDNGKTMKLTWEWVYGGYQNSRSWIFTKN